MKNFEKCTVAMLEGLCSQHVTGNTSRQNQPQSAIISIPDWKKTGLRWGNETFWHFASPAISSSARSFSSSNFINRSTKYHSSLQCHCYRTLCTVICSDTETRDPTRETTVRKDFHDRGTQYATYYTKICDLLGHGYCTVLTKIMGSSEETLSQNKLWSHKNIKGHTVHTIVSWPNPKQWIIGHTSDLMMIIRQSNILSQPSRWNWVNWKQTAPYNELWIT